MRKMRKALSFALILALVLTSFSFVSASGIPGSAISTLSDIEGLPGAEQITAGQNLGYISGFPDGTFRPDEEVNRAQMAVLIAGIMGIPDSALQGLATRSTFNDLSGFGWAAGAINFAADRNIVLGDGYGNFMPGRTVSKNEAMTMILRAIGYTENSEELVGRWPANYVALATQKDLYSNIVGNDEGMSRQNVAIALYNALVVEMVYVDLQGRTETRWVDRELNTPAFLANTGLGVTAVRGIITPSLYSLSYINVADRLGAYGWTFTNSDGELVAFRSLSTFITGFMNSNNTRFDGTDGVSYAISPTNVDRTTRSSEIIEGNTLSPSTTVGAVSLWNGGFEGFKTDNTVTAIRSMSINGYPGNETDGRQVTLAVELSGTTIRTIYSLLGWEATVARVVTESELRMIENHDELLGGDFVLDDDQEIDYKQLQLVGVKSLDEIEVGDVVYVYYELGVKGTSTDIRRVSVGKEVVEGEMTDANDSRILVDGKAYPYAFRWLTSNARNDQATNFEDVREQAGSDIVAKLDAYGNAFDIDAGGDIGTFGIYRNAADDARGRGIRLYTNDDATTFFNVVGNGSLDAYLIRPYTGSGPRRTSTFKIDGGPGVRANVDLAADLTNQNMGVSSASEYPTQADGSSQTYIKAGELFGYRLNNSGNVNLLERGVSTLIDVRSRTVVRLNGLDAILDPNAAVFWNAGTTSSPDWKVGGVDDIDLTKFRTTGGNPGPTVQQDIDDMNSQYILNIAGTRVIALVLPVDRVSPDGNHIYGAINTWDNIANGARSFTGFFDGATSTSTVRTVDSRPSLAAQNYVTFYRLTPDSQGNIRSNGLDNLVHPTGGTQGRFVTTAGAFGGTANVSVSAVSLGIQVKEREQTNTNFRFIELANNQRITLSSDVKVYEATWTGGSPGVGNVRYTPSNSGVIAVRGDALVWGFNTTPKAEDVTSEANVIIWMHWDNVPTAQSTSDVGPNSQAGGNWRTWI